MGFGISLVIIGNWILSRGEVIMKTVIVGPGAMGCLFAAYMAKFLPDSGRDSILLLDKNKERALQISQNGISVEGIAGSFRVPVKSVAEIAGLDTPDLIIICVKAYDTKPALAFIKPLVGDNTNILTLQNGVGNIEIISETVGPERVVGGVTNLGATSLGVGKVRFAGKGETVIGKVDGKIPVEMRSMREAFNRAGFEARISRDIKGLLWSKLIINVGINALTAITRLNNGRLTEFEGTRKILREAVTEAVKIAKRKRIKLIYDDPLAKVEAVCEATAANVSSMLQDVLKKKRTEIDFINGVIVRQGQEFGISVPVNTMLVELVKTIESSYASQVA